MLLKFGGGNRSGAFDRSDKARPQTKTKMSNRVSRSEGVSEQCRFAAVDGHGRKHAKSAKLISKQRNRDTFEKKRASGPPKLTMQSDYGSLAIGGRQASLA